MDHNCYQLKKLVRDRSVKNMEDKGTKVIWRTLSAAERTPHLLEKFMEEQQEVAAAFAANDKAEMTAELADLLEIIHALANTANIDMTDVEAARKGKTERRGGFSKGIYVDEIHCPKGSFYDNYCAKDPAKYRLKV